MLRVIRVGHQVDVVVGDELGDLVGARVDEVRANLLVDYEDIVGEHRVHDGRGFRALDPHRPVARHRCLDVAERRLRIVVHRVQFVQAVRDVLRRDRGPVAELVVRLQVNIPLELAHFPRRLGHLRDDLAVRIQRKELLRDAVHHERPPIRIKPGIL